MYKIIILTIAMLTLSACDSLGLSTAEPAEPVDLSSIEAKLDTIESKSEPPSDEYIKAIKANTKAVQENTKAVQENTKALARSKPVPNKEDSKPQSVNIISSDVDNENYGLVSNNPVVAIKPLTINLIKDVAANLGGANIKRTIYLKNSAANTSPEIIFEGFPYLSYVGVPNGTSTQACFEQNLPNAEQICLLPKNNWMENTITLPMKFSMNIGENTDTLAVGYNTQTLLFWHEIDHNDYINTGQHDMALMLDGSEYTWEIIIILID
tara:strand:- start:431 stop:1231 length:801 start_codon:yes stop_codon:yes gene_type:complete